MVLAKVPIADAQRAIYRCKSTAGVNQRIRLGHFGLTQHLPLMRDIAVQDATAIDATVGRAAQGDEVAFARLVAENHASMARVAFVVCGDPELTRDAVQAAWSIAWRRLHTLRDR